MNNGSVVEAYKSFYQQGKEYFAKGDIESARSAFLKAAELANKISIDATSYDVRTEYHKVAEKILVFVRENCVKKRPVKNITNKQKGDSEEEEKTFQAVEIPKEDKVTFNDVAGLQDVKDQIIYNVIEPLKNPELAKKYNIKAGGKIILYGPPGTGKTFIARAIAGEVDAKFYSIKCSDLISKYMGESSKQLDALFEEAQKNERAIIFFDEMDAVASKREDSTGGVDAEMARFVATFLTKVDGFKKSKTCKMLLLIGATNRPWALDPAMCRGGRFATHIYVGLPDFEARLFMIKKAMKDVPLTENFDFNLLAQKTEGYNGGDIVSMCDKIRAEAYKKSVKSGKEVLISQNDCDVIIAKNKPKTSKEDLEKFELYKNGLM